MSTNLTINGTVYPLPTQGDNPPWGESLSNIITALASVVNSTTGPSDILVTSFALTNNQSSPANVIGAAFNTASVRSAIISYSLYISTSTNELSECGQIYCTFKSTAGSWELAQNYVGISGVVFSITNAGQIQYTTTNVSGINYSGKMKFKASAFLQT
jgi:hypothetical protein